MAGCGGGNGPGGAGALVTPSRQWATQRLVMPTRTVGAAGQVPSPPLTLATLEGKGSVDVYAACPFTGTRSGVPSRLQVDVYGVADQVRMLLLRREIRNDSSVPGPDNGSAYAGQVAALRGCTWPQIEVVVTILDPGGDQAVWQLACCSHDLSSLRPSRTFSAQPASTVSMAYGPGALTWAHLHHLYSGSVAANGNFSFRLHDTDPANPQLTLATQIYTIPTLQLSAYDVAPREPIVFTTGLVGRLTYYDDSGNYGTLMSLTWELQI